MQGTLDVLILRTLIFGPQHGQGIARAITDSLTKAGREHFVRESTKWRRLAAAMSRVLGPETELT